MKRLSWELKLGMSLIALSIALNALHYSIFRDLKHIALWSLTSLAFLPISVLFVSLFIERLLVARDTRQRLEKMNMMIGTFFGATGRQLLADFSSWDATPFDMRSEVGEAGDWTRANYLAARKRLQRHECQVDIGRVRLPYLKAFLEEKSDLLLRLLENPFLLEHASFAETLRAVFHLADEMAARQDLANLPQTDLDHLAGDIRRAYGLLALQWIDHMNYLQRNYPYLFSLALRTNPFNPESSPVVK